MTNEEVLEFVRTRIAKKLPPAQVMDNRHIMTEISVILVDL